MLKHENPDIEIINKNLWAVHFSMISQIPQISYKPDPAIRLEHVPSELYLTGILVLNKDYEWYEIIRKNSVRAMKMTTGKLKKEIAKTGRVLSEDLMEAIYQYCLQAEWERRKIKAGKAA